MARSTSPGPPAPTDPIHPALVAGIAAALCLAVILGFKSGSWLDFQIGQAWPFWVVTAFLVCVLFLRPVREWPAYVAASIIGECIAADVVRGENWSSLAIAIGNAAAGVLVVVLYRRFVGPTFDLRTMRAVLVFTFAAVVTAPIPATTAWVALVLDGFAFTLSDWARFCVGDVLGLLTVTPGLFSVAWSLRRYTHIRRARLAEAVPVFALCLVGLWAVFFIENIEGFQLHGYIALPILTLVALRFGTTGTSVAALVLGLSAVALTANGRGPFAAEGATLDERVTQVQLFVGLTTVPMLLLAASITERRRAQAAQRRLEQHIARMERFDAIERMAGSIAHDFKNVLQVVISSTDMAMLSIDDGKPGREDLVAAREAASRGTELVSRLLSLHEPRASQPVPVDAGKVTTELQPMLRRLLPAGCHLFIDPGPKGTMVLLDRDLFERALVNLVQNAADALAPSGGEVRIAIESDGEWVTASVSDTGIGIPGDILPRIFEPFFTTKPADRGTGLGLPTVEAMVTRAGGEVLVESTMGVGTRFVVRLPRHRNP